MGVSTSDAVDLSLLDAVYDKHKDEPGSLLLLLQDVQAIYGFLPVEALESIADRLGLAVGKVHAVATFYSGLHFARQGAHTLKICDGTVCHLKGASKLIEAVDDRYGVEPGETTRDGALSVEAVYCLGACALAPAVELNGKVTGSVQEGGLLNALEARLAHPSARPQAEEDRPRRE